MESYYNIESLEQFGQWLVSGGYKENSNYKNKAYVVRSKTRDKGL